MGAFIARQPNGLLCRFSSVVDCVTDYNMTEEEYIEMCAQKAREEARDTIDHCILSFELVDKYFAPNNMTVKEHKQIMKEMKKPANGAIHIP